MIHTKTDQWLLCKVPKGGDHISVHLILTSLRLNVSIASTFFFFSQNLHSRCNLVPIRRLVPSTGCDSVPCNAPQNQAEQKVWNLNLNLTCTSWEHPWWLSGKESTYQCRRWFWSLDWEDLPEKEMATHSSIFAWKTPQTEEPGALQSMGSQAVGHNWATTQQSISWWDQDEFKWAYSLQKCQWKPWGVRVYNLLINLIFIFYR